MDRDEKMVIVMTFKQTPEDIKRYKQAKKHSSPTAYLKDLIDLDIEKEEKQK